MSRMQNGSRKPMLVDLRDIGLLGQMPGLALTAWSLPQGQLPGLAKTLAKLHGRLVRHHAERVGYVERLTGARRFPAGTLEDCVKASVEHLYLERLFLLRCYRPGSWRPAITYRGLEQLDAALAAGHGAILWVTPLIYSHLVTKMGFHGAGYPVSHLSRVTHGFSSTRVGRRALNPIRTTIEARHLAERLVIGPDGLIGSAKPLHALSERLQDNRVVSITVGHAGRQTEDLPFMAGRIRLATGAAWLAQQSGARLLPVFTVHEGENRFTINIEPALDTEGPSLRPPLQAYAAHLERYFQAYPDQFLCDRDFMMLGGGTP